MNFGNTLEEQYIKISAINSMLKKWKKVITIVFTVFCSILIIAVKNIGNGDIGIIEMLLFIALAVLIFWFMSKVYCWAWISFCEKYYPKGLAKSLSQAAQNSAIEGYVFGGESGAKNAAFGVLLALLFFAIWYILKGYIYTFKYWNLPKKEEQLKKQLEAKYGKTL